VLLSRFENVKFIFFYRLNLDYICAKIYRMKLRIGVLGAGHLGKIHINCIQDIPDWELVGFYDPDTATAERVAREKNIRAFSTYEELLHAVDAVDIVTPTLSHFETAKKALENGKHVFIEKPITETVAQAQELIQLAKHHKCKAQVGHVERFNPAFLAIKDMLHKPMFIEAHRLAEFNPRGTDVSVVLDLMIHDIDIILSAVKSEVKHVYASGVPVISDTADITNARIEFENGCVANLTASRISLKNMRKTRFFQRDAYITVDFLAKKSERIRIDAAPEQPEAYAMLLDLPNGNKKQIHFEEPEVLPNNAIREELAFFAAAINKNKETAVTLSDGARALELAIRINNLIESSLRDTLS
jgi:predicted dehydrogenase